LTILDYAHCWWQLIHWQQIHMMAVLSLNGRQLHGILKFDPSVTKPAVIQQQMPYPAASVSNLYPSSFAFLSFSL
jgi:hypothetical protein